MSANSVIEWTDATWNPTTGCTKVSPACANCYIERTPPFRIAGRRFEKGHIPLVVHEDRLEQPLHWKKPRRIFVNSLSDLFHEDIDPLFIGRVFNVMGWTPQHTFQVLTKRPERMSQVVTTYYETAGRKTVLDNVWLGVSIENQRFVDERLLWLARTPAAVRFISAEPLLSELRLGEWLTRCGSCGRDVNWSPPWGHKDPRDHKPVVDWVIAGAESGPRLRPTKPEWVRSLRDQCVTAGVPFFFKQWGGRTAKAGGRRLDGRTWDEMPEARA